MILSLVKTAFQTINILGNYFITPSTLLLLRKSRLFVKSRYSRNRQWSKSIVYFGLWFNIISVIWSLYYCYRYTLIFSHLYWLGFAFILFVSLRLSKKISYQKLIKFTNSFTYKY